MVRKVRRQRVRRKKNRGGERLAEWRLLRQTADYRNRAVTKTTAPAEPAAAPAASLLPVRTVDASRTPQTPTSPSSSPQTPVDETPTLSSSPLPVYTSASAEKIPPELTGRRLVQINHFFAEIRRLSHHGPFNCHFGNMVFRGEITNGLKSGYKFTCAMCDLSDVLWSEENNDQQMDVNTAAVVGIMSIGSGFSGLQELLGAMDVHCMTNATYDRYHSLGQETADGKKGSTTKIQKKPKKGTEDEDFNHGKSMDTNVTTCCATACTNTSKSHIMTRLPQDPQMRLIWYCKIDRDDWTPDDDSALCQIHFQPENWEQGGTELKPDAVPELFLHGEGIQSWLTMDNRGNVSNVHVRGRSNAEKEDESEMDTEDSLVFIKQETLEPDIDMKESDLPIVTEANHQFETVFVDSQFSQDAHGSKVRTKIKVTTLNQEDGETIIPEQFAPVHIKPEPEEVVEEEGEGDEEEEVESQRSTETVELKIPKQQKEWENQQIAKECSSKGPVLSYPGVKPVGPSVPVGTTLIAAPISDRDTDQGGTKKYLLLVAQPPQGGASVPQLPQPPQPLPQPQHSPNTLSPSLPVPISPRAPVRIQWPESAKDNSEMFSVSLAQFSTSTRMALKRKLVELVDAVATRSMDPEKLIIAYYSDT